MSASKTISKIPEEEITPFTSVLLEIIQAQAEEIQGLKDEIARLKGQKSNHQTLLRIQRNQKKRTHHQEENGPKPIIL